MNIKKLTSKDFKSDQEIRWCAGCGDTGILMAVQKAMANLGHNKEDYVVISGIGCSSRFPYYMNTYGFHGIHGRAGVLASGVKVANPKLSVWQITGDGDSMAIGGNHFIHEIRRNVDLNVILFNNEIYGLTKGQYSPTSKMGKVTKTSPFGTIEQPFIPGQLAIGAKGTFFARGMDVKTKELTEVLEAADKHKGTAIVEVLQNCVIFNDKTHAQITSKETRANNQLWLKHGEPMLFGENKQYGIMLDGFELKAVEIGKDGITIDDILVHDVTIENPTLHLMLVRMSLADGLPVAFGVIRAVKAPTYEVLLEEQIAEVQEETNIKCMDDLLNSGKTWEV